MAEQLKVKIVADASPLTAFVWLVELAAQVHDVQLNLDTLPFDAARVESDDNDVVDGKLAVTVYPSDALISYVASRFADSLSD